MLARSAAGRTSPGKRKLAQLDSTGQGRILLVEDDPNIRDLLREILTVEGYVIIEAADGEEALVCARAERPDLMLLDLMLPRKSGWSVIEELKRQQATRDIPVIVLSAFAHLFATASPAPPDAVMSKPFDIQDLLGQVSTLIRKTS
jgi:DNA-binding response OmpR family regulator